MGISLSRLAGVTLSAATVLLCASCSSGPDAPTAEHTATGAQAIQLANFDGRGLPAKTLALTFDDGPGSRTLELSAFLKTQGIRATFFVNGHCFDAGHPCGNSLPAATVFAQVEADGHLVANHTQDHLDLTTSFPLGGAGDAALLAQITQTDAIIAPYVDANHWLFRAPFGFWNSRDYEVVHGSAMDKYVGPINWNIGGAMAGDDATGYAADWDCWQDKDGFGVKTSAQCGARYLNEIRAVGRGIVLMHDADESATINNQVVDVGGGNTVDMVKSVIVPQLKAQGYTFVRADTVPQIAAAFGIPPCDASCASCAGPGASQCTACRAGSYLAGSTCRTCSACAAGRYQTAACSAVADTQCEACTICAGGTYTAMRCSANANTVCTACDPSCSSCTGPSANECDACPNGSYRNDGACHACSQCAAGFATSAPCSPSSDTACVACAPGTYAAPGATICTACNSCDDADACTSDACDATVGCVHVAIAGCTHAMPPEADAGHDAAAPPPGVPSGDATPGRAVTPNQVPPPTVGDGCAVSSGSHHAQGLPLLLAGVAALLVRRRRGRSIVIDQRHQR